MRIENPALAATFHEFLSRLLARRLVDSNATLKSLLD